jgi:peptide/nickel transport system substrate-binding protein
MEVAANPVRLDRHRSMKEDRMKSPTLPITERIRTISMFITACLISALVSASVALAQVDATLTIRYRGDISNIDPQFTSSLNDIGLADNLYSQLVRFRTGTAEIVGDLATDWEISDDGLTYTFHLREGVQWHRGYGEVTSADIAWSYGRYLGPEATSPLRFDWSSVDRIETPGPYTVAFVLSEPFAPFLPMLAYPRGTGIANQQAVEEFGADYNFNAIGSGPYMLEQWVPGERIVFEANPDYYVDGVPRTPRIVLLPIPSDSVAAGAIETGELALGLFRDPEIIARLESLPGITVDRASQSAVSGLYYDTRSPPFDDIRVRRAVHHAINKQELVDSVLTGVADVAVSSLPPFVPGATADVPTYEYDPVRARELLAEAGYPDGFAVTLLSTQLEPWPLVGPILQFYLGEVGIDVELRQLEHGTYGSERAASNYDMVVYTRTGLPDPITWMGLFNSETVPPGINSSYYSNAEVDELIERAQATVNPEARAALYERILYIVQDEAASVPLFHVGVQVVRSERVQGFDIPIGHDFPVYTVYAE